MPTVVTREDYFEAAMRLLATDGFGELKIATLTGAIRVTSGSFYHYFGNWDGFVEQLLAYWEREQTARIVELSSAPDDPARRVRTLKELVLTLPHEAETAIRAWSNSNPAVARVQRRVDRERHEALRAVVLAVVPDEARAGLLAVLGMTLLVGLQQWRSPVRPAELGVLLDEYEAMIMAESGRADG